MKKYISAIVLCIALCAICFTYADGQSTAAQKIEYLTDTTTSFNGLIARFKNRIIYIDMWATWCAPCRQELRKKPQVKQFADFAAKNDIVILYICCDRDSKNWRSFIKANNLSGYHILVNKYIYNDMHTTFSVVQKRGKEGIMKRSFYLPRHIIIDKNGTVADSTAAPQGSPVVYATLKKLLNK